MSKGIFQDPKKAGLFVGGTMVAVMLLIGSEDQEGALVQAAAAVEGSATQPAPQESFQPPQRPIRQNRRIVQQSEPVAWAEDSDLIDDTSGFDPTPEPFDPDAGDVYYVEDDY